MRRKEKQHRRLLSHLLNQPGPPQFQVKRIKHFPPVQPLLQKINLQVFLQLKNLKERLEKGLLPLPLPLQRVKKLKKKQKKKQLPLKLKKKLKKLQLPKNHLQLWTNQVLFLLKNLIKIPWKLLNQRLLKRLWKPQRNYQLVKKPKRY